MREILFRGKTGNGEWLYGSYVKKRICETVFHTIQPLDFGTYREEVVAPETVGQYTGLKDKNGKKIFEGDIVKCDYDDVIYDDYSLDHFGIGRRVIETTKICVCEIDKLNPCFVLRNIKNEYDVEYDFIKCDLLELEVVGNIYDNPELLEEQRW